MADDTIGTTSLAEATILAIGNHHAGPVPDLRARAEGAGYVSYYENQHGEQWIFIRDKDAGSGTLYGGDIGWKSIEIRDRTPQEVQEYFAAAGVHDSKVAELADPLAPNLSLDAGERAWLKNAWQTSSRKSGTDTRERDLAAIAKRLADLHDTPARYPDPGGSEYRSAVVSFAYAVGYEAGQRGLAAADADLLFQKALEARHPAAPE